MLQNDSRLAPLHPTTAPLPYHPTTYHAILHSSYHSCSPLRYPFQRRPVVVGATTISSCYGCRRVIAATSCGVVRTRGEEEEERDTLGPLLKKVQKHSMSIYNISKFSLSLDVADISDKLMGRWSYS